MYIFLKRRRTQVLLAVSFLGSLAWCSSYVALYYTDFICADTNSTCVNTAVHAIGKPFVYGYLLKSIIVAPLLILFTSSLGFRVWALISMVLVPLLVWDIVMNAPTTGFLTNKRFVSDLWGMAYFGLTVAIAVLVPLIEYAVRRLRA